MSKKIRNLAVAGGLLVAGVIICLGYFQPWNNLNSSDPTNNFLANDDYESEVLSDNNIVIGGEEVDYLPGDYGSVVVEGPTEEDFSSLEAYLDYEANWHDKSWKGEQPSSGRYKYAHYELQEGFEWVAGEIIVVFSDETDDARIREIAEQEGAQLGSSSFSDTAVGMKVALYYYPDDYIDPLEKASSLEKNVSEVEAAFPNIVGGSSDEVVSDPKASSQYYLDLSEFKAAWNITKCDGEVSIAILDTTISLSHPDLASNIDFDYAYDAIEDEQFSSLLDESTGHGTAVAGIASAIANNSIGIAGCSYNATILPIRVLNDEGKGALFDFSSALNYLVENPSRADVVNMSFGFQSIDWTSVIQDVAISFLCQSKINLLSSDYGIVFVAAAGNQGLTGNYVEYPAGLDNVVSVSAVTQNGNRADFSTANDTVDICAAGVEIFSTTNDGSSGNVGNGTSFAAPQVSAAAALLRAEHPDWSAERIVNKLESSATLLDGMTDVDENGKDTTGQYGYGLLNVAAALDEQSSSHSTGIL